MDVVTTSTALENERAGIQGVSRYFVLEKKAWQRLPLTVTARIRQVEGGGLDENAYALR